MSDTRRTEDVGESLRLGITQATATQANVERVREQALVVRAKIQHNRERL